MAFRAVSTRLALAVALAVPAAGCLPKIGDHCTTSLECSQTGQRICDVNQPDGYCTIFNCEPDTCPDAAACVAFNNSLDPACKGTDAGEWPRFERSFCVRPCEQTSECRTGYECVTVSDRGGLVVDVKTPREKACLPAISAAPADGGGAIPGVCSPGASSTLPSPYQPDAGGGGAGGTTTTGGSAGASGSGGSGGTSATGGSAGASGSGGSGGTTATGGSAGSGGSAGASGSGGAGGM